MALIRFGGGVVQMSGSIAGNTHARNRFGNYTRPRTKPVNPNSSNQQAVRNALNEMVEHWAQSLTAAERAAWNLYASSVAMTNRLGETIFLTGMNHFVRSNTFLARFALTIVEAGPTTFELPATDPALVITGTEAGQTIEFTFDDTRAWCSEDNAYMICYQGSPQNPQRNFFGGPWRICGYLAGNSGTPVTSPKTQNVAFAIAEGQRQWVYCRILRADGRLSSPFYANALVGA